MQRAELELELVVQQIERGTWLPPGLRSKEDRAAAAMVQLGLKVGESFRVFAHRWWSSKQLSIGENTVNDCEWRPAAPQRFFGRFALSEIDVALVGRFRDELRQQAETLRVAAEREKPLIETVTDRKGRTYERRRRPLSNTSLNVMIGLLGQILEQAVDYELIARNPVRVGGRSSRFLPRTKASRTFLDIDEFHALLDAAGALDAEAREEYKGLGRRAMVAALARFCTSSGAMIDMAAWLLAIPANAVVSATADIRPGRSRSLAPQVSDVIETRGARKTSRVRSNAWTADVPERSFLDRREGGQASGSGFSGGLSVGVARRATAAVIWSVAWIAPATAFTVPRRSASRTLGELRAAPAATAIPSGAEAAAARAAAATFSSVWSSLAAALSVGSFCVGSGMKAGYARRRARAKVLPATGGVRSLQTSRELVCLVRDALVLLAVWFRRVWASLGS
jgi:hypothetical protein